jgi:hypothetical protein
VEDIVIRLRNYATAPEKEWLDTYALEAANEIERLRAEIDGLTIRVFTLLKKLEEK